MQGTVKCFTSNGLFISPNSIMEIPSFLFYIRRNWAQRGYGSCLKSKSLDGTDLGTETQKSLSKVYSLIHWVTPSQIVSDVMGANEQRSSDARSFLLCKVRRCTRTTLTFLTSAKEDYEHAVISPGKSHIL